MFLKRTLTRFVHIILGFDNPEILPTYQLVITAAAIVFFTTGLVLRATIS